MSGELPDSLAGEPNGAGGWALLPKGKEAPDPRPTPIEVPDCDFNDPASLESWYGNFGWFEHYRKVVLSNCEELVRAKAAVSNEKITETRITSLARQHPNYLGFLEEHLHGRILRERNVIESAGR